ncbi:MAG: hypothetical protein J6W53_06440, partial [Candidatus Methanomethylophilaceae archaeon]|nr:hypothetical protein [Candidatus Methanomethylophilaceae archaeon]
MCYKVVKMRIEPNSSQRRIIDHTIDYNRYIFNSLITANKLFFRKHSRLLSEFEMNNLCTILRRRWPCFRVMHSTTHNDVSRRVHQACMKCMDNAVSKKRRAVAKGVMSAEEPLPMTWPRYRNHNRYDSYAHLSNRDFGIVESTNGNGKMVRRLKLGKVKGTVRCYNQCTPITGIPKTCIVTRKDVGTHTEYYACISYESETVERIQPENPKAVGIDL